MTGIPNVHFGKVDEPPPNWRDIEIDDDEDDDEELVNTPEDVIEMLGFDPKESK